MWPRSSATQRVVFVRRRVEVAAAGAIAGVMRASG